MSTTDFTTSVEKSIRYDRESKDYRCELLIDGEPISHGYASTYSQGEEWCNAEYYRILEDGVMLPPKADAISDSTPLVSPLAPIVDLDLIAAAAPALESFQHACADALPLPFEPLPCSHRAYGPQVSWDCMPQAPISTLQDGSTVYGQYDTDDSHFCACAETANGWSITADEHSVGINHHALGISLDELTPESWASLKALVQNEAVEHLFTCGRAWDTYQEVPAKQPPTQQQQTRRYVARQFDALLAEAEAAPSITIEQKVWPDIDDETYTSTVYRYGQAEVIIHHDGVPGNLTAYDLVVNDHNLDARDVQAVRDAAVLLSDARVQAALAVIGLPVPPCPAASAVRVERIDIHDDSDGVHGTRLLCGEGDAQVEVYFSDADCTPELYAFGRDGVRLPMVDRVLPNLVALMGSSEVREARMRIEAGETALPQSRMRRAA